MRKVTDGEVTDFYGDLWLWIYEQTNRPPHKLAMVLVPKRWWNALVVSCERQTTVPTGHQGTGFDITHHPQLIILGIEIQQNKAVREPTPVWDNRYCVRIFSDAR